MSAAPSTELVVPAPKQRAELVAGNPVAPIIPRTIDEVSRIAKAVIVAGLAPDSYKGSPDETISKVIVGIMKGAEVGLPPLTALANIAIINGRPCLYGDGAVALIQASGKVEKWKERWEGDEGKDEYTAICELWRRGQTEPYIGHFSLGDAKRAKLLTKGPWVMYLQRMLMWRARTYAMRTGFADCLAGLSIAEEVRDMPEAPKPVDTAFLEDTALAIEHKPTPMSEPLTRGFDILKRTRVEDVADLRATILEELTDDGERAQWEVACNLASIPSPEKAA